MPSADKWVMLIATIFIALFAGLFGYTYAQDCSIDAKTTTLSVRVAQVETCVVVLTELVKIQSDSLKELKTMVQANTEDRLKGAADGRSKPGVGPR